MKVQCPNCNALVDEGAFCAECGKPLVTATPAPQPMHAPAPTRSSGGGMSMLVFGCGCLLVLVALIVVAAGVGFFFMRDKVTSIVESTGISVPGVSASNAQDFAGTWVLENRQSNPDPDDMVVISVDNGRLIGRKPSDNSNDRIELSTSGGNTWTGTATFDGQTNPVEATLSEDKSKLTLTINPGTAEAQNAVLVRMPGGVTTTSSEYDNIPGIEPLDGTNSTVVEMDPGLARYEGNWRADEGIEGENNMLRFEISGAELVGRGGPGNRFTMRLVPSELGGLTGTFNDGQGNTIEITARLSQDWNTIYVTYNPPASEPMTSSFSRCD